MNPTLQLRNAGQSLWLDNITRELLDSGTLDRYVAELSVTGLTSNPTIYDRAIGGSTAYDSDIGAGAARGLGAEDIYFGLALDDLRRAADVFSPIHTRTSAVDGFVSLEVSPLLAHDASATYGEAVRLHQLGKRSNLLIKIPGTPEGLVAIEDCIFAGVPVNVTLLFSVSQYLACAEAYLRGIERRVDVGLPAHVASVASLFVSRWDAAVSDRVPPALVNRLGLAVGKQAYSEYRRILASDRWQRLFNVGARPQRLLFASTGTKDPAAPDTLYVAGLAAPNTINTMPEETLLAFADHGVVSELLDPEPVDAVKQLHAFTAAGIDVDALGAELQAKGARSFEDSWRSLLARIGDKSST